MTQKASNDSQLFYNAICQKEGTHYVVGFMFDKELHHVQLIEKNRPAWQAGRLNGVGGKVHEGEASLVAMYREFFEETGYAIEEQPEWSKFGRAEGVSKETGKPFCIDYYSSVGDLTKVSKTTDEPPVAIPLESIWFEKCLQNVLWLVPLALEHTISRGRDQKENGRPVVNIYYPQPPIQHANLPTA